MTGAYWMNAGALVLGLIAWTLGAMALWQKKHDCRPLYIAGSFAACSASLVLELFYQAHLASIEDVSAFLDTANAVALCAGALLLGTLLLNTAALVIPPQRRRRVSG